MSSLPALLVAWGWGLGLLSKVSKTVTTVHLNKV